MYYLQHTCILKYNGIDLANIISIYYAVVIANIHEEKKTFLNSFFTYFFYQTQALRADLIFLI